MRKILILLLVSLAALAVSSGVAAAHTTKWVPGAPYYASEKRMADALEKKFDHAYCIGVPRFGHRGAFPDEQFTQFDCTASDSRLPGIGTVTVRMVNDKRPGWGHPVIVRMSSS